MDASSTASLAPLSGVKSKVWRSFGFQVDDKGRQLNKKEVFCRVCKGRLPYSGNTTNLLYHLRTCHEEDYKTVSSSSSSSSTISSNQTTLTSYVANAKPYTRSSSQFKKCEDALLTHVHSSVRTCYHCVLLIVLI